MPSVELSIKKIQCISTVYRGPHHTIAVQVSIEHLAEGSPGVTAPIQTNCITRIVLLISNPDISACKRKAKHVT